MGQLPISMVAGSTLIWDKSRFLGLNPVATERKELCDGGEVGSAAVGDGAGDQKRSGRSRGRKNM